jgi:hypothetical protein
MPTHGEVTQVPGRNRAVAGFRETLAGRPDVAPD